MRNGHQVALNPLQWIYPDGGGASKGNNLYACYVNKVCGLFIGTCTTDFQVHADIVCALTKDGSARINQSCSFWQKMIIFLDHHLKADQPICT